MRLFTVIPRAAQAILMGVAVSLVGCDSGSRVLAPMSIRPSRDVSTEAEELAYADGKVFRWIFPSGSSNNQNELIIACFRAGPDMTEHANAPRGRLYAVFLPGVTQHACPDGSVLHDHILSAVPGDASYSTEWELWDVVPGPNFSPAIVPITSEASLLAAEQSGMVELIDDALVVHAAVIGPGR
jgi:hypothetical protein